MNAPAPASAPLVQGVIPPSKECAGCPLSLDGRPTGAVRGLGPADPQFVVVGDMPNLTESQHGKPGLGPAGLLLLKAARANGVGREVIWVTNAALCPPRRGMDRASALPKAIQHCAPRLQRELVQLGAKPMLLLGAPASQAFLGSEFKITELAGSCHTVPVGKKSAMAIPTVHPSAILRGGEGQKEGARSQDLLYWNLTYDVAKVARFGAGQQVMFTDDIEIEFRSVKKAEQLIEGIIRAARKDGEVGLDLETRDVTAEECTACVACEGHEATEARHARITALGLATADRAVSVAWTVMSKKSQDMFRRLLADKKITVTIHNRGYDEVVLSRNGFPIAGKIHCTQYLHHSAFPGLPHTLQRVATQFFAIPPWKAEFRHGEGEVEELLTYNARDTLVARRLRPRLEICVKRTDQERTYDADMKKCEVAARMQDWGMPIDPDVNRELKARFEPVIEQTYEELVDHLGDEKKKKSFFEALATEQARGKRKNDSDDFHLRHATRQLENEKKWEKEGGFNANSRFHVAALLRACGVALTSRTKKGAISTSRDVIEGLQHPVVRTLLRFRDYEHTLKTFIAPMGRLVDHDWRIHPVWKPNKISGRFGTNPNVQNWSKGWGMPDGVKTFDKWVAVYDSLGAKAAGIPNLRWQVKPKEGRILVGADKAQLEARIIGNLSGEPYLVRAFLDDVDIHSEFAKEIFEAKFHAKGHCNDCKLIRDVTKNCEYGYLYGAAIPTVHQQLYKEGFDIPMAQVAKMFRTFRARMPRIALWHNSLFEQVLREGRIRSFVNGRSRWFPLGNPEATLVKNFTVQSAAADIMDLDLWRLYQALDLKTDWIIQQGHDAIVIETDEDRADTVKAILVDCMTDEYTVRGTTMKYPCEADVGPTWADV